MANLHRVRRSHLIAPPNTGVPVPSANEILVGPVDQTIWPPTIPSGEAFGDTIAVRSNVLTLTGIPSAEAFGAVTIRRHPGLLRFLIATDNA